MRTLPPRPWILAALSVLSGLLQMLPFPIGGPVPLWRTAVCWVALVPLIYALLATDERGCSIDVLHGSFLGYLSGFVFYLGNCGWIFQTMHLYGGLPYPVAAGIVVLFCLYLGLYHALFGALLSAIRRRFGRQGALWLLPFVWVAVELARARVTGFPWDLLGLAQIDNPLLTRLAPFAGAYALSFVIALVNALWLIRIQVRDRPYIRPALASAALIFVALYVVGLGRLSRRHQASPTASATLVQENLEVGALRAGPEETRMEMMQAFAQLSRNPVHNELNGIPGAPATRVVTIPSFPYIFTAGAPPYQPSNLIVWPESPAGFQTNDPEFLEEMHTLSDSTHTPLIIGSLGVVRQPDAAAERPYRVYDSAAFFTPGQAQTGRYDKIHLVPWGEYIPFKRIFFFANRLTAGVGDMDPGTERKLFPVVSHGVEHKIGVFICYESVFADEVRQFVNHGAELLVNISDDGWYGDSGAPWQHLNMVRMRAIENHRWILRSTNTGITGAIDPSGRVVAALPRHIRSSINVPFGYQKDLTFYTRHGDLLAYLCALVTLAALVGSYRGQDHRVGPAGRDGARIA
jgi:apolipoprotein N-acyltransferase